VPDVDIVVVAWNHERWLPACLASLAPAAHGAPALSRVVIVDNASSVPVEQVVTPGPGTTVIRNAINKGFAAACNQGASGSRADFLLFLNPDTRLDAGALASAVARFAPSVGIVGLRLVDPVRMTQRSCGRFPSIRTLLNQALGLTRVSAVSFQGIRRDEWPHDTTGPVDFVCGAALMVRRELFERLEGFDPRFFLYLEDADLSLRAQRIGFATVFDADAVVEHACGWDEGSHRPWRLAHSWRSMIAYARQHLGPGAAVLVGAVVLTLGVPARMGEAVVERSLARVRDALQAWTMLCRMLASDASRALGRRREDQSVRTAAAAGSPAPDQPMQSAAPRASGAAQPDSPARATRSGPRPQLQS
jgi:GT2 family glycosyltransferase